jgi:hypothetical protein
MGKEKYCRFIFAFSGVQFGMKYLNYVILQHPVTLNHHCLQFSFVYNAPILIFDFYDINSHFSDINIVAL